ncbi:MAG: UDP-N-acetylmuramoyl-L-alanine--D-glutamate ligase [Fusobacteria bacterium]|nr:UDP-N-acetylmuramoyl-L-alanine--D-glutamate ligase [Fusobacteriota bacterium]
MKKVLVYGLGVSGNGAKKLLDKKNIEYICYDDRVNSNIDKKQIITNIKDISFIIKSPGIPNNTDLLEEARKNSIEIIDEIEFAFLHSEYKIIAITGSNGKTTVTTKIKELLEISGKKVEFAGNIGNSFAEIVADEKELDYLVLELSSYQLENIKTFKPYISMIINLTPDHLNRYSSLKEYYDAKYNIMKNQDENCYTIVNCDDNEIKNRIGVEKPYINHIKISKYKQNVDFFVKNGKIAYKGNYLDIEKFSLKGEHNLENILFILSVASIIKIPFSIVENFLYSTKSLEHRMENFYKYKNTIFINDSKGTNTDATQKALESYNEKLIFICGGEDKKIDLEPLGKLIKNQVKFLFLIGETSDILEKIAINNDFPRENIYNLKELEKVINKIKEIVNFNEKNIVLFSPAASSFDQFKNFEVRGKFFKEKIQEIIN